MEFHLTGRPGELTVYCDSAYCCENLARSERNCLWHAWSDLPAAKGSDMAFLQRVGGRWWTRHEKLPHASI